MHEICLHCLLLGFSWFRMNYGQCALEQAMNIFCTWHFHNASKEVFRPIFFWISWMGLTAPFCQFFHSAKIALLNPCIKFKFFGQKTSFEALWKCHIQKIFITCSRICQIQYLGQSKCNLRLLKKDSQDFKNSFNLEFL